ncbi:glycosyltransferase family 2 protein [Polynucleobacter sp. HIN8]|uniref:glycosyltransferase family 2 protein n=1 Tax=Polynucleobacter sp. HIN8 TaxID=3047867 RepID=UPI002573BC42|nr:glycosyltransferase family 2 protein [Polynucleobacter sp. HIN8]BEI38376.1 glycosyltransferase family 2 protein [Polynucleobacter sp. HIN8]
MAPIISVCIPAYNRSKVLPALLDSILNQKFSDFDIVITEDCSPERKLISSIVAKYQCSFGKKIKYFENEYTLGYDGNLRRLIQLACGDYVLFMGNDDLLAPGALQSIATAIQNEKKNIGVVLRSYSSFTENPQKSEQIFRYFDEDRIFPPGSDTVVTFFRRCVFISGMVFKRSSAGKISTSRFDGSLLYQQYLAGRILFEESGIYLNKIISYHRLGGIPDFGVSEVEKNKFIPNHQTPESSVHFIRGMISIANSLNEYCENKVSHRILRDIGNYSYPILSIQSERSSRIFFWYFWQLMKIGLWRSPLFFIYAVCLLVFGSKRCDYFISRVKIKLGRSPILGNIYAGEPTGGSSSKCQKS